MGQHFRTYLKTRSRSDRTEKNSPILQFSQTPHLWVNSSFSMWKEYRVSFSCWQEGRNLAENDPLQDKNFYFPQNVLVQTSQFYLLALIPVNRRCNKSAQIRQTPVATARTAVTCNVAQNNYINPPRRLKPVIIMIIIIIIRFIYLFLYVLFNIPKVNYKVNTKKQTNTYTLRKNKQYNLYRLDNN
jgi:hypothetical protein